MKPSTKRILVYFIVCVILTGIISYVSPEITFNLSLLLFGCSFLCFLICELFFFYIPKKFFGDDVDKKVEHTTTWSKRKTKIIFSLIIIFSICITAGIIMYFKFDNIDNIINYMFSGLFIFGFILTILKIDA
jgi:hypothetical protein